MSQLGSKLKTLIIGTYILYNPI
ncbi:uncharacterized protein METZ01_LOCUS105013 [marine metagenome]|uniref:Uncharacterized protein n=1 Tax=marine metagenome TaxID=408172 RepID=A0A381WI59_9ZZZZ